MDTKPCDLDQLLENYVTFLEVKYPVHYELIKRRIQDNRDSALAEAVVFEYLRSRHFNPKIHEDPGTGGVDFKCENEGHKCVVEVTSLGEATVASKSTISKDYPTEKDGAFFFNTITQKLFYKIIDKANQLSSDSCPRVLVIASKHWASDVLMGADGAELLLTGETAIQPSLGDASGAVSEVTELNNSAFIRLVDGQIEACRRSVSAVLLVAIHRDSCSIVGVLHPDPVYPLPIEYLPNIHLVRFKTWPPDSNTLESEWVISQPDPHTHYYFTIEFTNDELRSAD